MGAGDQPAPAEVARSHQWGGAARQLVTATATAMHGRQRASRRRAIARRAWREHRIFVLVVVAYVGLSALVGPSIGVPRAVVTVQAYVGLAAVPLLVLSVLVPVLVFRARLAAERASQGHASVLDYWRQGWASTRRRMLSTSRVSGVAIVFLLMPPFAATFSAWKTALPTVRPFAWDEALSRLDYVLHLGHYPWILTHAVAGSESATRAIDFAYGPIWVTGMLLVPLGAAAADHGWRRRQFLFAYAVSWVLLGTVGAYLLPSMGPCYYAWAVPGGPDPYAPLVERLGALHAEQVVYAVKTQSWLAQPMAAGGVAVGRGIAAFPSMHVAVAVLFALGARHAHRYLFLVALLFATVVVVGSVHLGWHYAVDAYASILVILGIWWACGRMAR
jgi:hypothetical protein